MLFTLGIDSQFGTLEGVITTVADMKIFPKLRQEFEIGIDNIDAFIFSLFKLAGQVFVTERFFLHCSNNLWLLSHNIDDFRSWCWQLHIRVV